jgi:hypothetical protein
LHPKRLISLSYEGTNERARIIHKAMNPANPNPYKLPDDAVWLSELSLPPAFQYEP